MKPPSRLVRVLVALAVLAGVAVLVWLWARPMYDPLLPGY